MRASHFPLLVIEFDGKDSICRCGRERKQHQSINQYFCFKPPISTPSNPRPHLFVKTHGKGAGILVPDAPAKCLERVQMQLQPKMKRVLNLKSWEHIVLCKERFWSTISNTGELANQTRAARAPSSGRSPVAAAIIFSVRHSLVL